MAMEILGFLIIIGLLIVFILRRDLWSGFSSGSKADEVEEASVKMRLQMEHTMNTLITQMDTRIHQIEGLVAAADERARTLEQQLAAVREEQANAQRKAEREIAAMRAAQNSYYPPREPSYGADYGPAERSPSSWRDLAEYRARGIQPPLSMQPIGGVSAVRRADVAARAQLYPAEEGGGFADALSESMHAVERNYGAPRGPRPAYYDGEAYGARDYGDGYVRNERPAETYAPANEWDKYEEAPRREARTVRWPESAPAEIMVEETPAAIVESGMGTRPEPRAEEPEEDEPIFTPEQLEELAKTEAEVVVSSSVADVVDLPVHPDEEAETAYSDLDQDENERILEAEDEAEPKKENDEQDDYDEEEGEWEDENEEQENTLTETSEAEAEKADETSFAAEDETETEEAELSDDSEEESEEQPESVDEDDEISSDASSDEDEEPEPGPTPPPVATRPDSPALRARELLEKGMSPADVTKETGMGRGAVDLLAQMVEKQRKEESGD